MANGKRNGKRKMTNLLGRDLAIRSPTTKKGELAFLCEYNVERTESMNFGNVL